MIYILILIIIAIVVFFLKKYYRSSSRLAPKILFLKLGIGTTEFFQDDEAIYSSGIEIVKVTAQNFDDISKQMDNSYNIVHLYLSMDSSGTVHNFQGEFLLGDVLNLVAQKGSVIAIIATEHIIEAYQNGNRGYQGTMSVVMTLNRNKSAFVKYFRHFFAQLFIGKSVSAIIAELTGIASQQADAPETVIMLGTNKSRFNRP